MLYVLRFCLRNNLLELIIFVNFVVVEGLTYILLLNLSLRVQLIKSPNPCKLFQHVDMVCLNGTLLETYHALSRKLHLLLFHLPDVLQSLTETQVLAWVVLKLGDLRLL